MRDKSTAEVSKQLNVHPNTIRDWTKRYGAMLSKRANNPKRKYTDGDLLILATIADYRDKGISFEAITDALNEGKRISPEVIPPETTPEVEQAKDNVQIVTIPRDTYLIEQSELLFKVETLTKELETTKQTLIETKEDRDTIRDTLQSRVIVLERDLSSAKAQLDIIRTERPSALFWLAVLLGVAIAVSIIVIGLTVYFVP